MTPLSYLSNAELDAFEGLYHQFQKDPSSVDQEWRNFFEGFEFSRTDFNQHNKKILPELKEKMATKIKLKSRAEWVQIFSGSDACVSPVLSMEEAQEHPHNKQREAFINIDGFNQPNASPRYSKTNPKIKHNAKIVGSDLDDICNEFNLLKNYFQ